MENKDYNKLLFNKMHIYKNKYDIIPEKDSHLGISIDVRDLSFVSEEFLNELLDSVVEWVYSQEKYKDLVEHIIGKGKNISSANAEIIRKAKNKFRKNDDQLLVQGQFGELLLFHFIQRFFCAEPILRKMPITTSNKHERFGADAIHYVEENGKNIIILGEAKTYTSDYSFNTAFENSINSILDTYNGLSNELDLYVYEDFLSENMKKIVESYLDNSLFNIETHLVSVVIYNETKKIKYTSENEIKNQINKIIENHYKNFDNSKIDIKKHTILNRITYIIFPVWALDELANKFQKRLN